jgi:hypothetical protein
MLTHQFSPLEGLQSNCNFHPSVCITRLTALLTREATSITAFAREILTDPDEKLSNQSTIEPKGLTLSNRITTHG